MHDGAPWLLRGFHIGDEFSDLGARALVFFDESAPVQIVIEKRDIEPLRISQQIGRFLDGERDLHARWFRALLLRREPK